MKNQPTVLTELTVGFGNNLFQFVYGKLLAEKIDAKLAVLPPYGDYFGLECLDLILDSVDSHEVIALYNSPYVFNEEYPTITISTEEEARKVLQNPERVNYRLNGYFEDFTLYSGDLEKIKSWFFPIVKRNTADAVLHLRLGDRLFAPTTYDSRALLTFEKYSKTLDSLGFDTLNIVSDLPEWKNYSGDELLNLDYHTHLSHGAKKMKDKAASYVNELVNKLSEKYEIKFHHKGLIKDFNFIRGFDKIMLGYSTFSWWAATLSDASWVGVFEPWRPWKENNKNLGKTNYPGWFGWK
jgi:hypothetical protein